MLKTLGAASVASPFVFIRSAKAADDLVVQVGSGDFADAVVREYIEPFQKASGLNVKVAKDWMTPAKLKLAVENKVVETDVSYTGWLQAAQANKSGYVEPIDYSIFSKANLDAMPPEAKQPYGVGGYVYSTVIVYDASQFSDPTKRPKGVAEFWDVAKFPGRRSLKSGVYGSGVYEEALIADGVAIDKLYPLDIDRAFKSLDRIKPHIKKWWNEGAEGQQLLADKAVDFGILFSNRASNLQRAKAPIGIEWNNGKLLVDNWIIPKGAPHASNAQRFIEFTTHPDRQAAFATAMFMSPTNKKAFETIDPEFAKQLPTSPENMKVQFVRNDPWYVEAGPDGKTNLEYLIAFWNKWITT